MSSNVDQILQAAKSLSPAERADLAQEIMLAMGDDVDDARREVALAGAVGVAIASIDAGEGIRVPAGGTREFVREIGQDAVRLVDTKTA